MENRMLSGAQILIEELVRHGVDTVFGYPGGAVLNIYDELYKNADRICHVLSAHEQGAAHAADGYARASGKTGVVIATSGPGATNLVTGIANAYLDSVPMVAITGNVASHLLGRDSFQEVDIVGITQPIVKHNFIVKDVSLLAATISEAFKIASSGRKGPVLIDIPKSVQVAVTSWKSEELNSCRETKISSASIPQECFDLIRKSRKPFIYCGGGVVAADAAEEVLTLSKRLSAPIGLSMMGLTAIPNDYSLNLGLCGMHGRYAASMTQSEADLMIAVGVRFSDRATGNIAEYTRNCSVIHIDIDAAEFDKNVSSHIQLLGDAKGTLQTLLEGIPEVHNEGWLKVVEMYKNAEVLCEKGGFTPKSIIQTVSKFYDEDTVVATDVGQHQMWVLQHYPFKKPRTLLSSGGLGTMGYGFGAAIGGCIATGRKRTVFFTSDGSFGMNLNEMATAVSQNLPITIILLNNGVLGMVRQWQGMFYEKRYSQTTLDRKTDFKALAQAFGAKGYRTGNLAELESIMTNGLAEDGPTLIECIIDRDEAVLPMIPPGHSVKDIVLN